MPARALQAHQAGKGGHGMPRDDTETERAQKEIAASDMSSDGETHATMGGAAAAGAVTGGVIGLAGGPVGAAIGAVGGAIVGAAAERMMHVEDENQRIPSLDGELDSSATRARPSGDSE
jgi:phage tail tape-measure protein